MHMTKRHSEGIRSIRLQGPRHPQQNPDHVLNLGFFGAALANQGLLDLTRRIFVHREPSSQGTANGSATGLTELQCGIGIFVHEDLLDGQFIRGKLDYHSVNTIVDLFESVGKAFHIRSNTPAANEDGPPRTLIDQAIAGRP